MWMLIAGKYALLLVGLGLLARVWAGGGAAAADLAAGEGGHG